MKKISIFCVIIFSLLLIDNSFACSFNGNIRNSLDDCFFNTNVVSPPGDLIVDQSGGFNEFLLLWIDALSGVLALAAVGAIVYGSFMLTISTGEDEKITKAKDIIKWALLGFIAIIVANALIELVINILYDI